MPSTIQRAMFAVCRLVVVVAVALAVWPATAADSAHGTVRRFLQTYCVRCHGATQQKADRRFDRLSLDKLDADTLVDLQDIVDQLNLDSMPPEDARQPTAANRAVVVAALTRIVAEGHAELRSTGGQTVLRRLNRREYLNTVGHLFAINMSLFDPTTAFPQDQSAEHLDNLGDVLQTSGYLLAQYLYAADQVVEKALAVYPRPEPRTWRFKGDFQQQPELRYSHGKVHDYRYLCLYETTTSEKHEGAYGPLSGLAQGVPADGYYEIKVLAEALHRRHPYDPAIFGMDPQAPFRLGVVPGNIQAGPLHLPQPLEPNLGEVVVADDELAWYSFRVWLDAGWTPRFTFPNGMSSVRSAYGQILRKYNDRFPPELRRTTGIVEQRVVVMRHGQLPQIRIHEVEVHGPLLETWPPASQQVVLGNQPFEPERTREVLELFARRAYRRPVDAEEIDQLVALVQRRQAAGRDPLGALKDALKVVLCSPQFLYLVEPVAETGAAPRLDAHALAARLSYFLWSSMPDEELSALADSGALLRDDVLVAQCRRLLASGNSDAFVASFLDSWLHLRSLGDMPPDRGSFAEYYTLNMQAAMKRETQLFTRDLIDRDASLVRFLDADYSFINRPLAQLYGMPDAVDPAAGHEFRRVPFSNRQRGGLLGQGSVLTVSANGIETSPVVRGIWLLENILGTPPAPPPDNVPAIDPDVRGATSMRDILTKHRDNPACYECHKKIDPLGFALENFDPIGGWRTRYDKGPVIDASGELPGGQAFQDVAGLKQLLVQRQEQFARMLTQRLLGYACGRRMEALDRPAIDRIVLHTQRHHDGLRTLIEQVVLSDPFRHK